MSEEGEALALIPGIYFNGANSFAFVQVRAANEYHVIVPFCASQVYAAHRRVLLVQKFPVSAFHAARQGVDVTIGPNHFSTSKARATHCFHMVTLLQVVLHVATPDGTAEGEFELVAPFAGAWPVSRTSEGPMGWLGRVPGMQCYHSVLSFGHGLRGAVHLTAKRNDTRQECGQRMFIAFAGFLRCTATILAHSPTCNMRVPHRLFC